MLGGSGLIVTTWAADVLLHPFSVTTTEYEPLVLGDRVWVVAPLLHK